MTNIKMTLRLNKILDMKEYLIKKAKQNKEYDKYVNNAIKKAEKSISEGRVRSLDCVLKEIEEEYGLMQK